MGLFEGIFSRLIQKKPEAMPETVFLGQLTEWYEVKQEPLKEQLTKEICKTNKNISYIIKNAQEKIDALQKAVPPNPNITPREKHFLQGNKEAYTKKISAFLEELALPEEIEEINGFIKDFRMRMHELAQGVARPMQILNEFLSHETREVTLPLGQIEKEIQILEEEFQKTKLVLAEKTKAQIQELQVQIIRKEELVTEINTITTEINELRQQNKELNEEITLLQNDRNLNTAKQQKQEITSKIIQMQKEILDSFSAIETAMKKYAHNAYKHKELATKYLESPIDALMQDFQLEITEIFAEIKRQAEHNKIEMKDKKIKKTLQEIDKITKDRLGTFLREYGQMHKDEKELQDRIDRMDVSIALYEKENRKRKNENKLHDLAGKKDLLKIELGKTTADEIRQELCEEIKNQLNVNLTISEEPLAQEETCPEQKQ